MRVYLVSLLLLSLLGATDALRFLTYNPMFGRSHITFMGQISEVLADAGHEVVMIVPRTQHKMNYFGVNKKKMAKIIEIPQSPAALEFEDKMDLFTKDIWKGISGFSMLSAMRMMKAIMVDQCNATIRHPGLLEELRGQHFDAAYGEIFDFCGFGLFHFAGIENTAITHSSGAGGGGFWIHGSPHAPSYVPGGMSTTSDKMSFLERLSNTGGQLMMEQLMMPMFFAPYDELFREFDPNVPSYQELGAATSLFFMNAEPLVDFPRPTVHKIVEIGGISVSTGHQPLNKTWDDLFSLRKQTVLLSFGSVALAHVMPEEYKNTIRATLAKFPEVTFLWKYEKPEHDIARGVPNIHPVTWVPQNDMLHDHRLSLFITHCGAGSTMESMTAGVPLIVIPVMGDQKRNAQIIKRIGSGLVLEKEQLQEGDALEKAIREILNNNKYNETARRTAKMLSNRPFTARETFVRNMEFLGEFGPLRNLDHYGRHLSFVQYYLLDVIAFFTTVILLVLAVVFFVLRFVVRRTLSLVGVVKQKKE